jgi:hypothetical protein
VWVAFRNEGEDEVGILHWHLVMKSEREFAFAYASDIPAPSMAEVWRELPDGMIEAYYNNGDSPYYSFQLRQIGAPLYSNTNPTDALIDLLLWVRGFVTMDAAYHDGSGHQMCLKCGFCLPCGDCKKYGCGRKEP